MIEWGQKSKPKKIPGPNFNPQKSHAKFLSHKNFWKAETVAKQVWFYTLFAKLTWPGIFGNYHESSDCFQYSQKFLLKSGYSSYPKNTFQNCPTKKNPKINNFKPKKIPQSSLLLEIRSTVCTPTPSPPRVFRYMAKVDNWVYFKPRQCLKLLEIYKETFYAFRRTQCTSLSGFLAFIQQLKPLFRDAWVPLTFFPASTLAVYHSLVNFVYELKHFSASTLW